MWPFDCCQVNRREWVYVFFRTQPPQGRQEDESKKENSLQVSRTLSGLSLIFSSSVAFSAWSSVLLGSPTHALVSAHSALCAHLYRLGSERLWGDVHDVHFVNSKYRFVKEHFSAE